MAKDKEDVDEQLADLDKAEQRHAEKQVQVAANDGQQLLAAHLDLLAELCVGQAGGEHDRRSDRVLAQIGADVRPVAAREFGQSAHRQIGVRVAFEQRRVGRADDTLRVLQRTHLSSVELLATAESPHTSRTAELGLGAALARVAPLEADALRVAAAPLDGHLLGVERDARALRVRRGAVVKLFDHRVEERAVGQLDDKRVVLLEHAASAVRGRLLFVEEASRIDLGGERRCEEDGRPIEAERIVGRVLHE